MKVDEINDGNKFVPYNMKGMSRRVHKGRTSILKVVERELKSFIFKVHEQGIQATNLMVTASRPLPSFGVKTL